MRTERRRRETGLVGGVRIDLEQLHAGWMDLLFRRQRSGHSVLGKWQPETLGERIAYYGWALVGALALLMVYPLAVIGFAVRYYASRLDSTATRLGITGVVLVSVVVWGGLTVLARVELDTAGFVAVAAASAVATVSASLAVLAGRIGGRGVTVGIGYPLAVTAVFLPPVVAALSYPPLEAVILPRSEAVAIVILDEVLFVGGLNEWIRATVDLEGAMHALMWIGVAVPVGWLLGLLVTLANLVRPRQ